MDKKGFHYYEDWVEAVFFVFLALGIILGVLSPSAFITYAVALFSGFMAGRLFFDRRHKARAAYTLLMIGFIMGYVIGTFHGDRKISFLLFLFGGVFSYYIFKKGYLKDILY